MSDVDDFFEDISQYSGDVPADHAAMEKLLRILESDIEAEGWDKPARLYDIKDANDPHLTLIFDMPDHPCDAMQWAFDQGLRIHPEAIGIAIVSEGYRHLYVKELPQAVQEELQREARELFPDLSQEDRNKEIDKTYFKVVLERFPRPSQMPADARREVRTVTAVFRDGTACTVIRPTRGEDKIDVLIGDKATGGGNVADSMQELLNDKRPTYTAPED